MRYDDDYVRPDAPFWGRIIVVLAVITAVPVVLWGTTAFVRSYVARPKIPTYHSLATNAVVEAPKPTAADVQAAAQPAAPSQPTKAAEAPTNAPAGAKADAIGPTGDRSRTTDATAAANQPKLANATPTAPVGPAWPTPAAASKQQPPVTTGSIAPQAPSARSVAAPEPAKNSEPVPAQAQPGWPTPQPMPQSAAAAPIAGPIPLPTRRPRTAAMTPEKPPPWYDPKAAAAAARNAARVPVPQQRPVEVANAVPEPIAASEPTTTEALPPAPPIAGPIPLPPRRPRDLALAQGAAPVPRTRPVAAPEMAPTDSTDFPWTYDPGASR